jgi:hypothetical protein
MIDLPSYVDGVPNLCGSEDRIAEAVNRKGPVFLPESGIDWPNVKSACAIALHMHQPLIPDPDQDLAHAPIISNLQYMMDHPNEGDNHNASVFHWCYKRMGEFIPQLVAEGKQGLPNAEFRVGGPQPRVMLDYSGTLLHGLHQMGLSDVFDNLRTITCEPRYRRCVEWLGSAWGHPVAPSTPVPDYRLHVRAWQHFFAAVFGLEALSRVKGFSPAEMALPNHPDVFYEFVRTLKECGYHWVIVQEHTVERVEGGGPLAYPHQPHRLIARNSRGETLTITAIIKTQGSDTKLIGQMQPYYEALGLGRVDVAGKSIPSLVSQISDGENGGVMMNEFPPKYLAVMRESSGTPTPPVNVTEYLEYLNSLGLREEDFPAIQPIMQHRIWERFREPAGPEALAGVIEQLTKEDSRFHVEGGSWTNNISWVRNYRDVLEPMAAASALFHETVLQRGVSPSDPRYRNALYHLLTSQTSCYRYWGQGLWSDRGRELCRRTMEILRHELA